MITLYIKTHGVKHTVLFDPIAMTFTMNNKLYKVNRIQFLGDGNGSLISMFSYVIGFDPILADDLWFTLAYVDVSENFEREMSDFIIKYREYRGKQALLLFPASLIPAIFHSFLFDD